MVAQVLRRYQREAVEAVFSGLAQGHTRILYSAATGCGKTTIMAEICRRLLADGRRILVLAHRKELIGQAHDRIRDHCGLSDLWEIGMEIAGTRAHSGCRVIVGSVDTCRSEKRLPDDWRPTAIVIDEAHRAAAKANYRNICARFGVDDGECLLICTTATPKRTDRQSLYALNIDGTPVMLEDKKTHKRRPADPRESVCERHVYEYSIVDAVEDGWLVPLCGMAVATDTSLDDVPVVAGKFHEAKLAKAVDNARRTMQAITAWREAAADRQTIVFCASVEHAHHSAELWQQAGYSSLAVDGETDDAVRGRAFADFKAGRLQVICNVGVFTEGADMPNCSCIVHLRPTRSWVWYVQASGRATRPLPGLLDGLQEASAEERRAAIAASAKPDALIIDLADLYEKCGELCSVPSILDLPARLDLQGHSLTEAKRLLDEFEQVRESVIGECPLTFEELQVRLEAVDLMRRSGASSVQAWRATDDGYRYVQVPPGYRCDMLVSGDSYRLVVAAPNGAGTLLDRTGKPGLDIRAYLDSAAKHALEAVERHRASMPKPSRGTLLRLTPKQAAVLRRNGHSATDIDAMPYGMARNLIAKYMDAWRARQQQQAEQPELVA